MTNEKILRNLSKEELITLIEIYSKNWLALDGVWFQSVERKLGMDEAIYHDKEAWKRFTVIEARRIKEFLKLEEHAGLEGLKRALQLRAMTNIAPTDIVIEGNSLTCTVLECRVQTARKRKNMPYHPCKPVGEIEYSEFGKAIDDRLGCECVSCYPYVTDDTCSCKWKFTLKEKDK